MCIYIHIRISNKVKGSIYLYSHSFPSLPHNLVYSRLGPVTIAACCSLIVGLRIRSDPVFLHGSGSGSDFQISLDPDPDPVFKFFWIRIRIRFQPRFWNKKNCRKVSKSDLSEENLKFMTKDRQKMKKATISY